MTWKLNLCRFIYIRVDNLYKMHRRNLGKTGRERAHKKLAKLVHLHRVVVYFIREVTWNGETSIVLAPLGSWRIQWAREAPTTVVMGAWLCLLLGRGGFFDSAILHSYLLILDDHYCGVLQQWKREGICIHVGIETRLLKQGAYKATWWKKNTVLAVSQSTKKVPHESKDCKLVKNNSIFTRI